MSLELLLASIVAENRLAAPRLQAAAKEAGVSEEILMERLARTVAERFLAGNLSWADSDVAMNCLIAAWPWSSPSVELPPFAFQVYLAFDASEDTIHADALDSEDRTRRLLLAAMADPTLLRTGAQDDGW